MTPRRPTRGATRGRAKNQVSLQAARDMGITRETEWQKKVIGILRANGWKWDPKHPFACGDVFHDKARSTTEENKRRQAGLPDLPCRRTGKRFVHDPQCRWGKRLIDDPDGSAILILELKVPGHEATERQAAWIYDASRCEGTAGVIAYPTDREDLVFLVGGVDPDRYGAKIANPQATTKGARTGDARTDTAKNAKGRSSRTGRGGDKGAGG